MQRLALVLLLLTAAVPAHAAKWVTSWAASVQGPYPSGNASAQPDLRFALPDPADGAHDQTFRLIVAPSLWGHTVRIRLSNVFGTKPITFDGVFVGLQSSGATIMPGSNRPVRFAGKPAVTVAPGHDAWSDGVTLPYVSNPAAPELMGRKLAISLHVDGSSGAVTWHAKAMQTSYLTAPGAGRLGEFEDESAFPSSTTSWFFVDALDVMAPNNTRVVVCLGDSLTDGTNSTLNGDDRWPDDLARRLRAADGPQAPAFAVVNAGIGGNRVLGPAGDDGAKPAPGGPGALSRLARDVTSLSGVTDVIWLEGINDFGSEGDAEPSAVRAGFVQGAAQLRKALAHVRILGGTLPSTRGTTNASHQSPDVERRREALNTLLRADPTPFDAVIDFDRATLDPKTGALRAEFVPGSTIGGPGDGLHPNRAGYQAMADAVDLRLLDATVGRPRRSTPPKPPKDPPG